MKESKHKKALEEAKGKKVENQWKTKTGKKVSQKEEKEEERDAEKKDK